MKVDICNLKRNTIYKIFVFFVVAMIVLEQTNQNKIHKSRENLNLKIKAKHKTKSHHKMHSNLKENQVNSNFYNSNSGGNQYSSQQLSSYSDNTVTYSNPTKYSTNNSRAYADIPGESSNTSPTNRLAVSVGNASPYGVIMNAEQLMRGSHTPQYVEKLKYYDEPPSQRDSEALSVNNPSSDNYYRPFQNRPIINLVSRVNNCEMISSPYMCQSTPLCVWDSYVNICVLARR